MTRRLAAVLMALVVLGNACASSDGTPEQAVDGPLAAAEIDELLRGNTAVGRFLGERYRQFFDADGTTAYVPLGNRASFGEWRVNDDDDTYESVWAAGVWEPYEIHRIDGELHWVGEGFDPESFEVLPGQQVTIPDE